MVDDPGVQNEAQALTDDLYHDKLRRNQAVQDMAATDGWGIVVAQALDDQERAKDLIVRGGARDWDDYKRMTEVVKAIQTLIDIPHVSQRHIEEVQRLRDEDQEEQP